MASVRKKGTSRYWFACYKLPNGKRKQVSTRMEDRNAAMQMALKLERAAGLTQQGVMTREYAMQLVDEITSLGGLRILDPIPVSTFLEDYYAKHARTISKSSAVRYEGFCKRFLGFIEDLKDQPLVMVTSAIVAEWRDSMLAEGLSPKTVKYAMGSLKLAFDEAVGQQRIEKNPFETVKRPTIKKSEQGKKKAFTWDQFRELISVLEGEWRICVLIGGLTGQRQQDVAQLDWSQIDFEGKVINFRRKKNQDSFVSPMRDDLCKEIRKWHQFMGKPDKGKVLPDISALPGGHSGGFAEIFRFEILPKIGIVQPYEKRAGSPGRTTSAYSYHSLRHMLSTVLNAAGVSIETRMLVVGHSDRKVSQGYTHAKLKDASNALCLLPNLCD